MSELRIAQIRVIIVSYRDKSYVVIAGAAALVTFLISKGWCFDALVEIRIVGIAFCMFAAVLACCILAVARTGVTGVDPRRLSKMASVGLAEDFKMNARAVERVDVLRLWLLFEEYRYAFDICYENYRRKEAMFGLVSFFMAWGVAASLVWVCLKIGYAYFLVAC